MHFDRKEYADETLIHLYKNLLFPRMIEEKMLLLLRQGKISKWFSGIGQEAISVGVACALQDDEWIMPLHRNLGIFTTRNIPLQKLFDQWQGDPGGFTKGRDRSFHFGSKEHFICGMISHLGPQLSVADGTALAAKLKKEQKVSLAFTGEGGTSEGDFHEALNVASVWELPVIFIIENNGYGLSTPVIEQYRCRNLVDKAVGYGMEGIQIDGNNILEVYDTIARARLRCIDRQQPVLIECMTFRMRGHEEASGTKYVPKEMFKTWMARDPIKNYERYLLEEQVLDSFSLAAIKDECRIKVEALHLSDNQKKYSPGTEISHHELSDVYAVRAEIVHQPAGEVQENVRFIDSIKNALNVSLANDSSLLIMGQDIAEYGGAFKITEGFVGAYGKERIRNTPLCESAILGAALGLSLEGFKSVVEMQFADFVSVGFNQIVNNLAKLHYRWGHAPNVVIRMPTGAGVGAGPFHSQSNEAWFTHVPGLKIVYPSTPQDAKGLLIAAINDPNPVLYFEHKALYRSITGPVPAGLFEEEIGKAKIVRPGDDVSIITYGAGVHWALDYVEKNPDDSIEILDLRTLLPFDTSAISATVRKTGKVLILHEDTLTGGLGGEIAAWIAQHCFEFLDAPIARCASLDTPVPFAGGLEKNFLANARLATAMEKLIHY